MRRKFLEIVLLGLLCFLSTCDRDRLPSEPDVAAEGQIVIVFEDEQSETTLSATQHDSSSNTLTPKKKSQKSPQLSAVNQLEARVLKSDNSQIASQTTNASEGRFRGSITVNVLENLKVLLIGRNNGIVERFSWSAV